MTRSFWRAVGVSPLFLVLTLPASADPLPKAPGPLSPKEELATFKIVEGFKVELVAAEPDVVDPVAMCFDAKGRMFVCEMRGYPNGGVGTGNETRGKIKCLEDKDGDGVFETTTTFAEGLRFPMGITPYKNGFLVAVAPDILFLEDTNGDGKADKTTVLYTGFNLSNIQQMVNALQWGLDNWIYGSAGSDGGTIKSVEKPDAPAVVLRNRGFRFKPDVPGSLEPTSGGGQFGLTADDYQRWFTATNSQHLRQIVLPDHYLKRNPHLAVNAVTIDIPEHGAAAKVFRISPFEPWRVERTTRRAGGPDAKRFPANELVPGGYITSACSPLIYTADLFPKEFYGNNFVCDPANNLIHRELLKENGAVFTAVRAYPDREFLASTDNWFRPVFLSIGPDGAIYMLDFYREAIETPLSLPDDIKKQLNLESRGRGRIWRIAPTGFKPTKFPDLSKATPEQLAKELVSTVSTRRLTAQRLIVEQQLKDFRFDTQTAKGKPSEVNLLWTRHGLGRFDLDDLETYLKDDSPRVREQALRIGETLFQTDPSGKTSSDAAKLMNDIDPRVRFQLALSASYLQSGVRRAVVLHLLRKESDPWIQTAVLCSVDPNYQLIEDLLNQPGRSPLTQIAAMIGAKGEGVGHVLHMISRENSVSLQLAVLDGLGQGMRNTKAPLSTWWANPPADAVSTETMLRLRGVFEKAAITLLNEHATAADRISAAGLLAHGPFGIAGPNLRGLLTPSTPVDIQLAGLRSLAAHTDGKVAEILLKEWKGYGPSIRAAVLDALLSRPDRTLALLAAVEKKEVASSALSLSQVQQLKAHPNAGVKAKAEAVFKQAIDADRAKVVASYATALELKGDAKAGKGVFAKNCSACHKLDGVGHDVGANLLATLGNKSGEDLLTAVFDPNREVDPRYLTYQVGTADERILTGIIVAETPTSITVRRAEGVEDVVLRSNLSLFRATSLSLMPVGLEKELKPQDVADLFAYLRTAGK